MSKRPDHVKPPKHLSPSPPVPEPEEIRVEEEHGGRKDGLERLDESAHGGCKRIDEGAEGRR